MITFLTFDTFPIESLRAFGVRDLRGLALALNNRGVSAVAA